MYVPERLSIFGYSPGFLWAAALLYGDSYSAKWQSIFTLSYDILIYSIYHYMSIYNTNILLLSMN